MILKEIFIICKNIYNHEIRIFFYICIVGGVESASLSWWEGDLMLYPMEGDRHTNAHTIEISIKKLKISDSGRVMICRDLGSGLSDHLRLHVVGKIH